MESPIIKEIKTYKTELLLESIHQEEIVEQEFLWEKRLHDAKGLLNEYIEYTPNNEIFQKHTYAYNEQEQLIEEKAFDEEGEIISYISYEYNNDGTLNKEIHHYNDDTFDAIHFEYNDKKLLIETKKFENEEDLEELRIFKYENDMLIGEQLLDSDGNLIEEKSFKYNGEQKPIEEVYSNPLQDEYNRIVRDYNEEGRLFRILRYNRSNKLIEKTEYFEDQQQRIVKMIEETPTHQNTTEYLYDEKGDLIEQTECNKHGELNNKVLRKYNQYHQLTESEVIIDYHGKGINRNYKVRNEIVFN